MPIKWHVHLLNEMENLLNAYRIHKIQSFKEAATKNKEKIIELFDEQQKEIERLRKENEHLKTVEQAYEALKKAM